MKFTSDVVLHGHVEVEAESAEEAKEILEDGFDIKDFNCEEVDINDVYLIKESNNAK